MVQQLLLQSKPQLLGHLYPEIISELSVISGTMLYANQTTQLVHPNQLINARWGLIPSTARNDYQSINRLSAEASSIGHSSSFRLPIRKRRAILPIQAYYFTHQKNGVHWVNKVCLKNGASWNVPVVYEYWSDNHQRSVVSFALIHHTIKLDKRSIKLPLHFNDEDQLSGWFDQQFTAKELMKSLPDPQDFIWTTDQSEKTITQEPTHFSIPNKRDNA